MPNADADGSLEADRSILITGAASGIGLATARLFARQRWFVGAIDVNAAALAELGSELGSERAFVRALDVTDRSALLDAVDAFAACTKGRLDLLFANAGIDAKGPFEAMSWERIAAVVGVNLVGTLALIHARSPRGRRRRAPGASRARSERIDGPRASAS